MQVSNTFKKNIHTKKRIVVNRGGSSSSKTYSILQMLFKWLKTWELRINEYIPEGVITVWRQYRAELWKSVLRDWKDIVKKEGMILNNRVYWWDFIRENKSELTYEYYSRTVEFVWCDEIEKAKWPRRKGLYINEANNVTYQVFMQMLMRTDWPCFLDFNPDDDEVRINTKIEQERAIKIGDVEVVVSTFRDNAFLSKTIVWELLNLRILDPDLWNVFWNWNYWKIKGAIFEYWKHWFEIDDIPEEAELKGCGQDYWFTTDPTVLVRIYTWGKDSIILDEVFREYNLINTYKEEWQKQSSIQWQYELYWIDYYEKIYADSSEPKSNEELFEVWYNIEWVTKWPWSVVSGIKVMKKYKIYVTARSLELRKEFRKYVRATNKIWETLKDKEGRPIPLDKYNHWLDWARYWITHLLGWNDMSDLSLSIK